MFTSNDEEEMIMNTPTYKEYLQLLKESNHKVVSAVNSTSGQGRITLVKDGTLRNDKCELVTCIKECSDQTVVLSVLVEEEYGWSSIPLESEMFGKNLGGVNLSGILNQLPSEYTDKQTALKYLSRNPSHVVEMVSQVLNTQKSIIDNQYRQISNLDWDIANVYSSTSTKVRKLMNLLFGKRVDDGQLPSLKKVIEKLD